MLMNINTRFVSGSTKIVGENLVFKIIKISTWYEALVKMKVNFAKFNVCF